MTGRRLPGGGLFVDRERPVEWFLDGGLTRGLSGDTVASAMLAQGRLLAGRSFKYHRARGVFTCGAEEPNALVTVGPEKIAEPNLPATMVEVTDGLTVATQNRWPSLRRDAMSVTGAFSRFLGAGFYYKTFMGPGGKAWLRLWEPMIRRAAGLGRLRRHADAVRHEKVNAFCDVLVVGAGAAGLAAALAAGRAGARVMLADEGQRPGGSLFEARASVDGRPASGWLADALAELAALDNVTLMPRTTVTSYYDGNVLAAVERVTAGIAAPPAHLPRTRHHVVHARQVVIATGAVERPPVFAGNDLPGVMLADAMARYAVRYAVAPGETVVLSGATDSLYDVALTLADLGVAVTALADARPHPDAARLEALSARGIAHFAGAAVSRAIGRGAWGLRAVEIAAIDQDGTAGPVKARVPCEALGVSAGWTPLVQLPAQAGGPPVWDERAGAFLPGTPREAWHAAGAVAGTRSLAEALRGGVEAAAAALAAIGLPAPDVAFATDEAPAPAEPAFPLFAVTAKGATGKAFVDLQNDVTTADVALAHREGYVSVEHLKRYTTLGMATDQGRTSNVNGLALMARLRGLPIPEVGTTRFRAPAAPVPLGAIAGGETGEHFRPWRLTAMHDWHVARGADMLPVGQWLRPRVYREAGESLTDAYIREARTVRETAGIVDVSTLGKIAVAGPDAAEFLDRVYVNGFAKLAVGKARYGVMLREDGFVFDDGTVWRLAEHEFIVTTTTANAAAVLAHLEFLLEVDWPDLRVSLASVTDAWAGFALAGPLSRAILSGVLEGADLSDEACPFMGIVRGAIADRPVLVARLSFSGERAYEVMAAARDGLAVWEAVVGHGTPFGLVPYGTEAMGALRIEKGHVSGPELDGRTTLGDLGLAGMASKRKDFLGKALMEREAMTAPDRLRLVGLTALEDRPIRAGAHLLARDGNAHGPEESLGHVTSPTYSPALGTHIALALLSGGPERAGEELLAAYPLDDDAVPVRVVSPHFFDAEGRRLHG